MLTAKSGELELMQGWFDSQIAGACSSPTASTRTR